MTTIATRTATRRQELGLTQAGLAKRVGVAPQSIQQLEAGHVAQPRYLLELADALHVTPEWLLHGDAAAPASTPSERPMASWARDLPVLGTAMGGDDASFETNGQIHEHVPRPPALDAVSNAYALYMTGDSMEPRYFAGEIIYVNPNRPPQPGEFVVLQLSDGRGMVKRLRRRTADRVVLEQYNPAKVFELPRDRVVSMHLIVQAGRA